MDCKLQQTVLHLDVSLLHATVEVIEFSLICLKAVVSLGACFTKCIWLPYL